MTYLNYDGSFQGLLTAIFDVYDHKLAEANIVTEQDFYPSMFDQKQEVITIDTKADRVWQALKKKLSSNGTRQFYKTFLSEEKNMENHLLSFAQHVFTNVQNIEGDFGHPAVLYVAQTAKKVDREKHRMEAFVRFQLLKDNIYFSSIQPDYNVLPLIERHFKERYADQQWIIYDATRDYGLHYDLHEVHIIEFKFAEGMSALHTSGAIDDKEPLYQLLWRQYFSSVNIKERKNTRLHLQHMPRRHWKYLPEKH